MSKLNINNLTVDRVIGAWMRRAIIDFYLYFFIEIWPYKTFFLPQGVEKLCKAYILGKRAEEYISLPRQDALEKINKIAKESGHNLKILINEHLPNNGLSLTSLLNMKYIDYTGTQLLEVLEAAYMECRYPMPNNISKKFPTKIKGAYWDLLNSEEPGKFAYAVARQIIEAIEKDFSIIKPLEIPEEGIKLNDWQSFCQSFFGVEN